MYSLRVLDHSCFDYFYYNMCLSVSLTCINRVDDTVATWHLVIAELYESTV